MNSTLKPSVRLLAYVFTPLLIVGAAAHAQTTRPAPAKASAKAVEAGPQLPSLTVAQILEKHVAARGSADAWKAVQGLQLTGQMEAGRGTMDPVAAQSVKAGEHLPGKEGSVSVPNPQQATGPQVKLPFVMDFARPNKSRLEIEFQGKKAIQVFDGTQGWKLRPYLNRNDVVAFDPEELKSEASRAEPEGLLVGYAAKGSKVELDGTDKVDGQGAYKLKVTEKGGQVVHVWIDAKTFLDVRVDGSPHRMDGKMHDVHVTQRDFRSIQGVMIPYVLETSVDGYPGSHKMLVEKATVNPSFEAGTFDKPKV